jgi:hypothetical protein
LDENLEQNSIEKQPSLLLLEQVNSNQAAIALEKIKKNAQFGGIYWQTLKLMWDSFNGISWFGSCSIVQFSDQQ